MDDIVKQALAKWPNVPDCYGWLGLDARGDWYMRDDRVQAQGSFLQSKGSRLQHDKLIDFIGRNYEPDANGRWYFQNGPQRVYVELELTPWVWRLGPNGQIHAHTAQPARMQRCYVDEQGRVYLETDLGFGLLHTQDVFQAATYIEEGLWVPHDVASDHMPQQFGYVISPQASQQT
jgi:hypothetical protein